MEDDGSESLISLRAGSAGDRAGGNLRFYTREAGFYNGAVRSLTVEGGAIHAEGSGGLWRPDGTRIGVRFTLDVAPDGRTTLSMVGRDYEWELMPLALDQVPVEEATPPDGVVAVDGYVRYPLAGASAGSGSDGDSHIFARVDLDRFDLRTDGDLEPFYLELTSMKPAGGSLPVTEGFPELSDGPHLSYAVQWFAFALVSTFGLAALIRSTARRRSRISRREEPQQPDSW